MKIAHVEASNIVPSYVSSQVSKKVAGNSPKSDLPKENGGRLEKIFESLNLQGIGSWTEQQQQSVRSLIKEYQHLFVMNLSELGKTSLVQHDIKLDDMTPFKEHYRRIPHINMKKL